MHDELAALGEKHPELPVRVIDPDDKVRVLRLGQLATTNKKKYAENLSARTVVLPPTAGGLTATGTLSGAEVHTPERFYDVAGRVPLPSGAPLVRMRVTASDGERTFRLVAPVDALSVDFAVPIEDSEARDLRTKLTAAGLPAMRVAQRIELSVSEDDTPSGTVEYLVLKPEWKRKASKHEAAWPALDAHLAGVSAAAKAIAERSGLPADVVKAAELVGKWHDLGKDRGVWQRGAGNRPDCAAVAKPLHGCAPENLNHFRHELASMVDVQFDPQYRADFDKQSDECRELVLHLIATPHGRGRPHFPENEATDPERLQIPRPPGRGRIEASTPPTQPRRR